MKSYKKEKSAKNKYNRWVRAFTQTAENWSTMRPKAVYHHIITAMTCPEMPEAKHLLDLMNEHTELKKIFTQESET